MSFYATLYLFSIAQLNIVHAFPASTSSATAANDTVVLPPGISNHGDPSLICRPARWTDIAVFYLGNYIAHAATVVLWPGSSLMETAVATTTALLFPGAGLYRAIKAISSGSIFAKIHQKSDLLAAARAGALCTMFANVELKRDPPRSRLEIIANGPSSSKFSWLFNRTIHGICRPPVGYVLFRLPEDVQLEVVTDPQTQKLCNNYNVLKVIVALAQTLYTISTLYDTKGDQLQRFGYAAFGLTVAPYLFMSVMNLIGNLIRPDYPTLYLVRSRHMDDLAQTHPENIDGVVGTLSATYEQRLKSNNFYPRQLQDGGQRIIELEQEANQRGPKTLQEHDRGDDRSNPFWHGRFQYFTIWCALVLAFIPIAIIGGMSSFNSGQSTRAQRSWIMVWIVFGAYFGWVIEFSATLLVSRAFGLWVYILCGAPAIGGMVVVGQEIISYGVCKRL